MAGLPKKYMSMKGISLKQKWALYNKSKGKGRKSPRRVPQRAAKAPTSKTSTGISLSRINDVAALGSAGIYDALVYQAGLSTREEMFDRLSAHYTGFKPYQNAFEPVEMIKGFGPSFNRTLEKKAFRALKIKGPRAKLETFGDVLDNLTYYGQTAIDIYDNRATPHVACERAVETQYGIRLQGAGFDAYNPTKMITHKIAPYVAQKYVRKFMRKAGMNLSFKGLM